MVELSDLEEATEAAREDLLDEFLELVFEIFEQLDDLDDIELCSKALFKYGDSSRSRSIDDVGVAWLPYRSTEQMS